MKALRDALDQELLRGHRLQSRLMELDHTLHSQSLREPFEGAPKNNKAHGAAGLARTGSGSTAVAPSLEDVAFDDYLSSLRKDGGVGRGKARPASAKLGKSGGARAAGDKQRPVSAGGNAGSQKDDGHVWWGRGGEFRGSECPGGSSAMDVVISNRQASVPTDSLRQEERPKRAPPALSASSTHTTNVSATSVLGANSTTQSGFPKQTLGSLGGGTEGSQPLAKSRGSGVPDASSLGYLRSNVVSGHVTKTSHLELKVEYCGRKSFSVRHKVSLSLSFSLSLSLSFSLSLFLSLSLSYSLSPPSPSPPAPLSLSSLSLLSLLSPLSLSLSLSLSPSLSFSLCKQAPYNGDCTTVTRNQEEKYTLLAEQVKAAAFDRFKGLLPAPFPLPPFPSSASFLSRICPTLTSLPCSCLPLLAPLLNGASLEMFPFAHISLEVWSAQGRIMILRFASGISRQAPLSDECGGY